MVTRTSWWSLLPWCERQTAVLARTSAAVCPWLSISRQFMSLDCCSWCD